MSRRVKAAKTQRGGERRPERLQLRAFKSLLSSHATAMCARVHVPSLRVLGQRTGGMASRCGGGAHEGGGPPLSNRKSFHAAAAQKEL